MIPANVKLSSSELSLACDADFILTKNRVIEKVYALFGILSETMHNDLQTRQKILSPVIYSYSPKIYRGEKYRGLPYVMLDCPRCFERDDIFAIRSFFWWGNQFSITLHVAGKFAEKYGATILQNIFRNDHADFFICISDDQWEHHFEPDNFIPLTDTDLAAALASARQKKFLKISKRLPLEQWDNALSFFTTSANEIFDLFNPVEQSSQ